MLNIINNLYYWINENSILLIFFSLLAIVLFIVYKKYLPNPSTIKSIIFPISISFIISIELRFRLWLFPENYLPGYYFIINKLFNLSSAPATFLPDYYDPINNLVISVIMSIILIIILDIITKNYKISIKIGGLTGFIVYVAIILLGFPAI